MKSQLSTRYEAHNTRRKVVAFLSPSPRPSLRQMNLINLDISQTNISPPFKDAPAIERLTLHLIIFIAKVTGVFPKNGVDEGDVELDPVVLPRHQTTLNEMINYSISNSLDH